MAETSDSEKSLDVKLPDSIGDADPGKDWETAFEAEDFFVDDNEDAGDFFLADDESGETFNLAALLDQESAGVAESGADKPESEKKQKQTDEAVAGEEVEKSLRLPLFLTSLRQRYLELKPWQRISVPVLPLCLLLSAFFLFRSETTDQKIVDSADTVVAKKTVESPPEKTAPPAEPLGKPAKIIDKPAEPEEKTAAATVMVRKKWPFSSFFIAAEQTDNKETVFLSLNLTLITLLPQGASLPEDKGTFVRNMIYQFYVNQPAYELKRYSLARGEMIRRLRSWINRQWPDSPIETIAFNRYQVLK